MTDLNSSIKLVGMRSRAAVGLLAAVVEAFGTGGGGMVPVKVLSLA